MVTDINYLCSKTLAMKFKDHNIIIRPINEKKSNANPSSDAFIQA